MTADPVIPLEPMPEIPNKLYFRIGEVAKLAGVKPYVLRFWESEFPALGPKKSGTGHRLYRRKEVEMVLEIKRLLYDKRFTIEGARKWLGERPKQSGANAGTSSPAPAGAQPVAMAAAAAAAAKQPPKELQANLFGDGVPPEALDQIRTELKQILELLNR